MFKRLLSRRSFCSWRFVLFACAVLVSTAVLQMSAAGPDFAGTWKLDAQKSDFGQLPSPSAITDRVTQHPGEILINRDRDGEAVVIRVPLNESERENTIRGMSTKTRGRLNGDVLVINYETSRNKSEEHWSKSPDGSILTVKRHLSSPRGETDQTLVMVRQ